MSKHFNETANFPAERITDELIAALAYDEWYEDEDDDDADLYNAIYSAPYGGRVTRRANMD